MTYSIATAYVQGIQSSMYNKGLLNYASEQAAAVDAQVLGSAIEEKVACDLGGLATEGASLRETEAIADTLLALTKTANVNEKNDIIHNCISSLPLLEKDAHSKFAEEGDKDSAGKPADNNVVAGHASGSLAAGEENAKKDDLNKELSNAVTNTADRPSYFNSLPGQQADKDKGHVGVERNHEGADAQGAVSPNLNKELSNAVPNTATRANDHGAPGKQKDADKGHVGTEKAASTTLSNLLAQL